MKSSVLFLVFNRPETTRQVFEAIRRGRPKKLYVAADGPRIDRPAEILRCEEVRNIATAVDWPCEVHTFFRESNLGCKLGVSSGINWFFDHESEGIILEDDVLPTSTFFVFCDEMLERYRNDHRIAMITGTNFIANKFQPRSSYFFSRYNHIWGWASWRRSWKNYDVSMIRWPMWRDNGGLSSIGDSGGLFDAYWRPIFDSVYAGKIDTWDYQWTFACWLSGGLAVMPAFNQTRNLGFGSDATHTTSAAPAFVSASPPKPLVFPLIHPEAVEREAAADRLIDTNVYAITYLNAVKRIMKSRLGVTGLTASFKAMLKNVSQ